MPLLGMSDSVCLFGRGYSDWCECAATWRRTWGSSRISRMTAGWRCCAATCSGVRISHDCRVGSACRHTWVVQLFLVLEQEFATVNVSDLSCTLLKMVKAVHVDQNVGY